jgi:hypothetical protein
MANRSDFFSAKLPRSLKKMIALGEMAGHYNKHQAGDMRDIFIKAHAHHVAAKSRRMDTPSEESDPAEAV